MLLLHWFEKNFVWSMRIRNIFWRFLFRPSEWLGNLMSCQIHTQSQSYDCLIYTYPQYLGANIKRQVILFRCGNGSRPLPIKYFVVNVSKYRVFCEINHQCFYWGVEGLHRNYLRKQTGIFGHIEESNLVPFK